MVAAVVEAMLCAQILRKRGNARQPLADQLRLAQRAAARLEFVGHAARRGTEVAIVPQHALRQGEHVNAQIEQILDRIAVLKPVHAPNRRVRRRGLRTHGAVQ